MQTSNRGMASHRSLLPALLLLLAAVISSSDASNSTMPEDRREGHLEPADEAGYRTYMVLLQQPPGVDMDADAHKAWHTSYLPSLETSLGEPRLRESYWPFLNAFSARLTDQEVVWISAKPGFVRAFPNFIRYLQTTRTPAFLGLNYYMGQSSSDWKRIGYGGLGMVIGIVDGGIANSHPSMHDDGFSEPPQRWKGSCDNAIKCNRKLIGAKNFLGAGPPLDVADGHGTHVASIAAGNFVAGANFNGLATGNACGMAPQAHVAVYKACDERGCSDEAIMSAIKAAVDDGVDVISVSIGDEDTQRTQRTYDHDPTAIAAFAAMQAGVLVVACAGNGGPIPSSVVNDAPWLFTVGAGTVDRSLVANVIVDDEHSTLILGQSLANRKRLTNDRSSHDLLYDGGRQNCDYSEDERRLRVPGRIVVCQAGPELSWESLHSLLDGDASAVVTVDPPIGGYTGQLVDMGDYPIVQVPYNDGAYLKSYSSSEREHPRAAVDFTTGTIVGPSTTLAPTVAYLSGRGPSRYPLLKPDVLAPGVNILAGIPLHVRGDIDIHFGFMSGTSMAVPHVSGAAILLKRLYPTWSPAAIRSALMTTADINDNSNHPIQDDKRSRADAYMMGAGHINVVKAMDPGLVYELDERQYAAHIRSTLGEAALRAVRPDWRCSDLGPAHPSQLNYPSLALPLQPGGFTVRRALTNVDVAPNSGIPETYTVKVDMDPHVRLTVDPSTITFTQEGDVAWFEVSVSRNTDFYANQKKAYTGSIEWSSSKHTVRSPVIVVDGLVTSVPPMPLKLD